MHMPAGLQWAMVNYYNFLTAYEDIHRNCATPNSNLTDLLAGPPDEH